MSTKATTYESLDNKIAASTLTEDLVKGLEVVDGHAIKEKKDYEKPDELYDMLIARIRQYHPSTDISMIEKAYELARKHMEINAGSPESHTLYTHFGWPLFWQIRRWIKKRSWQECSMT